MSEHLEKARGALAAASSLDHSDPLYVELLDVARVQAAVATAAALEGIQDGVAALLLTLTTSPRSAIDSALAARERYGRGSMYGKALIEHGSAVGGNQETTLWPLSPNGDVS